MAGPNRSVAATGLVALALACLAALPLGAAEGCAARADSASLLQLHSVAPPSAAAASSDGLPDCTGDPYNRTCRAVRLACWLDREMTKTWSSRNKAITAIHQRLRELCVHGELPPSSGAAGDGVLQRAEVEAPLSSGCGGTCAPDVVAKKKTDPAFANGMKVASAIAKGTANMMKVVLQSAGYMSVAGAIVFGFLNSFLGAFFPGASSPQDPCHLAVNYGECMWGQIKPFVEKYVKAQIDGAFESMWSSYISGFQSEWNTINSRASDDSAKFPNGTVKHMPKGVQDQMYDDLHGMWLDMGRTTEFFLLNYSINTTNALYLTQFASMHISVGTSLFSSWKFRTLGDKHNYQSNLLCYTYQVFLRAREQRTFRLSSFAGPTLESPYTELCSSGNLPAVCKFWHVVWTDRFKGCDFTADCKPGICESLSMGNPCIFDPQWDCASTKSCFQQHVDYVTENTDELWSDWLAPLPEWLQQVIDMDKAVLRNTTSEFVQPSPVGCFLP